MSKFFSVRCKCGTNSIVFGNATSVVACPNCKTEIVSPTGGRAIIHAKIMEAL